MECSNSSVFFTPGNQNSCYEQKYLLKQHKKQNPSSHEFELEISVQNPEVPYLLSVDLATHICTYIYDINIYLLPRNSDRPSCSKYHTCPDCGLERSFPKKPELSRKSD